MCLFTFSYPESTEIVNNVYKFIITGLLPINAKNSYKVSLYRISIFLSTVESFRSRIRGLKLIGAIFKF